MIKRIKEWGNGAGARVPRKWLGMEVEIKPIASLSLEEIRKEVMNSISPYLADVEGVYLTGSYARGEQTNTSDVDILVISDKPVKIRKREPYDIYVISRDKIYKTIRYYPLQIMSMIREGKPIINGVFLEDLKKIKLKPTYFREYLKSTKSALDIINNLLEGYKDSDKANSSLIYPIILRLRGLYLVESLLKNKKYKTSDIKMDIEKLGIEKERIEKIYRIYQIKRDSNKGIRSDITIDEIKKIYGLTLKKYKEVIKWVNEK